MLPRILILYSTFCIYTYIYSLFLSTTILTVLTRLRDVYYLYKSLCRNTTKLPLHESYTERKHNAICENNDVIYCRMTLSLPRMQITVLQRYIFHACIVKWNLFKKMDSWKWRWNKKFWIQKYWKKISSQLCLLHNVWRCYVSILHFISKVSRILTTRRFVNLTSLKFTDTIETVSMTNQPESRPSFFFFFFRFYSTTFRPFPRIYFRLVNIELAQRCLVYSLLMVNTDLPWVEIFHDNVNSLDFYSCFFFFLKIHIYLS